VTVLNDPDFHLGLAIGAASKVIALLEDTQDFVLPLNEFWLAKGKLADLYLRYAETETKIAAALALTQSNECPLCCKHSSTGTEVARENISDTK
jgi:hypothetical protein